MNSISDLFSRLVEVMFDFLGRHSGYSHHFRNFQSFYIPQGKDKFLPGTELTGEP